MKSDQKKSLVRTQTNDLVPAPEIQDYPNAVQMLSRQLKATLITPALVPRTTIEAAAIEMVSGINPRDLTEGLLATQMVAAHNMVMECYRRNAAADRIMPGELFETNLRLASKMSSTFAALSEALDRHRGRGSSRVSVETVNVQSGGQAIVGNVETPVTASRRKRGPDHIERVSDSFEPLDWGPAEPEFKEERAKRSPSE